MTDPLESVLQRMGEPSWWILSVLEPTNGIPGIEIIRRVNAMLAEASYPQTSLDPSTLHYALRRMQEEGLVEHRGDRMVEVPGPRGTVRNESRAVYGITGLGAQVLAKRLHLNDAMAARAQGLASGAAL
ncbi:MAG TPA: PadR family transcriptional regulator [Chloroflexota bacterium]|nr:PadR family transcriptional regulator [Chloroflexota bacterium]